MTSLAMAVMAKVHKNVRPPPSETTHPEAGSSQVCCCVQQMVPLQSQRSLSGIPATYMTSGLSICRTAPEGSLILRLALHALLFANARSVAALWLRFVHELRFRYWETGRPLPHIPDEGMPDMSCSLIHQKLQMLSICIRCERAGH